MTRKRRRRPSRAPLPIILLLLLAAAVLAARILPRHSLLRSRPLAVVPMPSALVHPGPLRQAPRSAPRAASLRARIYFLRVVDGKERLLAVTVPVAAGSPAREALRFLATGPAPEGCQAPLPEGTKLRGVVVRDGIAAADFSRELMTELHGGADDEGITVYAIVDTLCSLPGVRRAQILVEGRRVDSLGGHLAISAPLPADTELVIPKESY